MITGATFYTVFTFTSEINFAQTVLLLKLNITSLLYNSTNVINVLTNLMMQSPSESDGC